MDVLYPRAAGLDVHKKSVVACVLTPEGRETKSFGTMSRDLLALADWLSQQRVTHAAMESTGVFWKPVYNVLEEEPGLTVMVVNAQHIKAVPGRKTDVKDAEWIADLVRHGLVRPSFIPERPQRELRELVRYRRTVIQQRSQVVNRVQQVLEGANIKLSTVASDVFGVSGRAMLEAMVAGVTDPEELAALAKASLRKKLPALEAAFEGRVGDHARFMLRSHLQHLDFLDSAIDRLDAEVAERLRPFDEELALLDTIPGVGVRGAQEVLAEIGSDMNRFPTAAHLASWAKVCPGNRQSAGKRRATGTGHGNRWLGSTLVEAAWAAARSKATYLNARYHRLAGRRGAKRAAMAVAHTILVMAYHILRTKAPYRELGGNYFDERERTHTLRRAVARIERLGYRVSLDAVA
ncbi:MAG: IS110 family transposase [Chloroflexota bacterium]